MTSMKTTENWNVAELLLARRTVHSYTNEVLPPEILERAITCAIHAPNHRLTFPWRFYHVGPVARAALAELQESEFKKKKFLSGGELLVVGIQRCGRPEVEEEDYASLAAGLQNMALYLWSVGYGTKWSTGAVTRHPRVSEIVGVSSAEVRLCGFFWIGRPEVVPDKPERPALSQFLVHLP